MALSPLNQPSAASLYVVTWLVAAGPVLLAAGVDGLWVLTAASLVVPAVCCLGRLFTRIALGARPSAVLGVLANVAARMALVFGLITLAMGPLEWELSPATLQLFGCCVVPFYLVQLAIDVRSSSRQSLSDPLRSAQLATSNAGGVSA